MTASLRTLKMGVILGSLWEARFGYRLGGSNFGLFADPVLETNARSLYQRQPGHRERRPLLLALHDGQYLAKKGMEYLNSVSVQFETPSIGLGIHVRKFKPGCIQASLICLRCRPSR